MADWKHRLRESINRFGIDLLPLSRSPVAAYRGLQNQGILTVLDVGANEGQFARRIRRLLPDARVIAFEPLPRPFERLNRWAARQRGRAVARRLALGTDDRELVMHHHIDHDPSSSVLPTTPLNAALYPKMRNQEIVKVRQTTLDRALATEAEGPELEILLKMDVQGYEDRVLQGAPETIAKVKACLLEVGTLPLYESQASFEGLVAQLAKSGLRFAGVVDQVHDGRGKAIYVDALFLR